MFKNFGFYKPIDFEEKKEEIVDPRLLRDMPRKRSVREKIIDKHRYIRILIVIKIDRIKRRFRPPSNKPRGEEIMDKLGIKRIPIAKEEVWWNSSDYSGVAGGNKPPEDKFLVQYNFKQDGKEK